jgi:cell wall-associated NlpC family hydrolase
VKAHALAWLPLLLAACAGAPPSEPGLSSAAPGRSLDAMAGEAAGHAVEMLGKPYRFGGASPEAGFDCSGLVHFSYLQAGVRLPHNTDRLRVASKPVELAALRRGDLLFFDHEGKKNSHVGIYLGGGAFVHAPSTGKTVRSDRLDSSFWKRHLSEARRPSP